MSEQQAGLMRMEGYYVAKTARMYQQVIAGLTDDIIAVERMIAARQAAGLDVPVSWLHRQQRYKTMIAQASINFEFYGGSVNDDITQLAAQTIRRATADAATMLEASVAGQAITGTFNRLPTNALNQLTGAFDQSSPLREVTRRISNDATDIIEREMKLGLAKGIPPPMITGNILKSLDIIPYKAALIARTEMYRSYREANRGVYAANPEIAKGWIWFSHRGSHTCAACLAMHGTEHPLDEPMGSHPNCRCTMLPKTASWEELGFKGLKEFEPDIGTGEDFLRSLDDKGQKAAFGNVKLWRGWKNGEYKLQDVIRRVDSRKWGTNRTIGSYDNALRNRTQRLLRETPEPVPVRPPVPSWASDVDVLMARPVSSLSEVDIRQIGQRLEKEIDRRIGPDLYGAYEDSRRATYAAQKSYDKAVQNLNRYIYENPQITNIGSIVEREALYPQYKKLRASLDRAERKWTKLHEAQNDAYRALHAGTQTRPLGEVALEVLEEIRPGYGKGRLTARFTADSHDAMKPILHDAMKYLPEEWVDDFNKSGRAIRTQKVDRGYFDSYEPRTGVGNVEVMAGQKQNTLGTMIHESGHFREFTSSELRDLETAFYLRRTAGESAKRMPGYAANEVARHDKFLTPYIGKDYGGRSYELLTMGIESIFSTTAPVNIRADKDYFQFILGLLAKA